MESITQNEQDALNQLFNGHDGEDLTSPYGGHFAPEDLGPVEWNKKQRGGLVTSLLKKGLVEIYDAKEYSLGCDIIVLTYKGLNALA